eukprot:gene31978-39500_t
MTFMAVWTLGLNHTTAPLDLRGRFAFAVDKLVPTLQGLRRDLSQRISQEPEAAILSTCNRTEIYCAADQAATKDTLHWLAQTGGVSAAELLAHTYVLEGNEAARHAFRVASGLDSMVLGEAQILGQLKDAVRAAEQAGALGITLNQLFQRSFAVAKEVRSSTEIGAHSISMAAASVRLASQLFEDLKDIRILFVGAGEMNELVATHFAAKQPKSMAIANRSLDRGELLASRFGAEVMPLADLPERLHEFDAVISCTASTLPLIGLGAVERALKKRKYRPMFMVDLAVPRDIEPEVKSLEDVYLYTVDDLASVVQAGQAQRQAAVADAEIIINAGVQSFSHWLGQRDAVPLIQQLQNQADAWREAELARARKLLARGDDPIAVMEALSKGLTQKMLHGALAELRGAAPEHREQTMHTVQRVFLRKERRGLRSTPLAWHTACSFCTDTGQASPLKLPTDPARMKPFLIQQLERYALRLTELDFLLSREDIMADMTQFLKLSREHAEVSAVASRFARFQQRSADLAAAQAMLDEEDMREMAEEEAASASAELQSLEAELQRMLLPKDPDDARPAFVEIRAGTGGDESALFAGALLRMASSATRDMPRGLHLPTLMGRVVGGHAGISRVAAHHTAHQRGQVQAALGQLAGRHHHDEVAAALGVGHFVAARGVVDGPATGLHRRLPPVLLYQGLALPRGDDFEVVLRACTGCAWAANDAVAVGLQLRQQHIPRPGGEQVAVKAGVAIQIRLQPVKQRGHPVVPSQRGLLRRQVVGGEAGRFGHTGRGVLGCGPLWVAGQDPAPLSKVSAACRAVSSIPAS